MDNYTVVATALLAALLVVYGVLCVFRVPTYALWGSIPLLLWPTIPEIVKAGIVAVLLGGVALRHGRRVKAQLFLAYSAFAVLMALGWFLHPPGVTVERSAALNSLIAALLNLGLVVAVAAIRPPLITTLKVLGLSGSVVSIYVLTTADILAGRAWIVGELNPNTIGVAAAAASLCLVGLAILGKRRWLLLSPLPLSLLVLSQSRSGLLVLCVGILLLATSRWTPQARIILATIGLVTFPYWSAAVEAAQRLIFANRDGFEVATRGEALSVALETAAQNPLVGVGWRQFTDITLERLGVVLNAHNDYLLIAAEGGLLAATLFVVLMARAFTFAGGNQPAEVLRALLLSFLLILALGNHLADLRSVTPLYVLLGIAWGIDRRTRDSDTDSQLKSMGPRDRTPNRALPSRQNKMPENTALKRR